MKTALILTCICLAAALSGCRTPWSEACDNHGGVFTIDGLMAYCNDGSVQHIGS